MDDAPLDKVTLFGPLGVMEWPTLIAVEDKICDHRVTADSPVNIGSPEQPQPPQGHHSHHSHSGSPHSHQCQQSNHSHHTVITGLPE